MEIATQVEWNLSVSFIIVRLLDRFADTFAKKYSLSEFLRIALSYRFLKFDEFFSVIFMDIYSNTRICGFEVIQFKYFLANAKKS